jgi:hypothetical protein
MFNCHDIMGFVAVFVLFGMACMLGMIGVYGLQR